MFLLYVFLIHLCYLQQWKYLCKARSWDLTVMIEIQEDGEQFSCFSGHVWFVFPEDF